MNRLERYLTLCYTSKIEPIIVVSKIDLTNEQRLNDLLEKINDRVKNVPVIQLSNETQIGVDELRKTSFQRKNVLPTWFIRCREIISN